VQHATSVGVQDFSKMKPSLLVPKTKLALLHLTKKDASWVMKKCYFKVEIQNSCKRMQRKKKKDASWVMKKCYFKVEIQNSCKRMQ
jgi:hypothetical protein